MNPSTTDGTTDGRVPIPGGGIMPPMVTPLRADRSPDLESIDSLVDFFVDGGATGALVLGSCGENGALSRQHRYDVAARTIERSAGRMHITVGLVALGLADACDDAKEFAAMGADSILAPASFVFPNSQNELEEYFGAIGDVADGIDILDTCLGVFVDDDRTILLQFNTNRLKVEACCLRCATCRVQNAIGFKNGAVFARYDEA